MEFRTAGFTSWNPRDRSMTDHHPLRQHRPGPQRRRGRWATRQQIELRGRADRRRLVAERRRAGRPEGRRRQRILPALHARQRPADAAHRRHAAATASTPGAMTARWIAYTSTRRNGTDNDIYVMDPRDPLDQPAGRAGPAAAAGASRDFTPTAAAPWSANISRSPSPTSTCSTSQTGRMTPIGDHSRSISYGGAPVRAGRHLVGDLGRGLGVPAARHDRSRHRRASAPVVTDIELGRRELRHRRRRPLHRLSPPTRPAARGSTCSIRAPAARRAVDALAGRA